MEQKAITQEEKTKKEIRTEKQGKRAQADLTKIRRENNRENNRSKNINHGID